MVRSLPILLSLLSAAFITGCYETEQFVTLNADGSGKIAFDTTLNYQAALPGANDPDSRARALARMIISRSQGVTVWRDVGCRALENKRIRFKGTAYFQDVSKLRIHEIQLCKFTWAECAQGLWRFAINDDGEGPKPMTMGQEALKEQVGKQKADYDKMRKMAPALGFGPFHLRIQVSLPGNIKRATNLKKAKPGVLQVTFDLQKASEAMDQLVKDDAWVRQQILAGYDISGNFPMKDPDFRQKVFGEKGPIEAIMNDVLKPQFDYEAEVEQAQKELPAMLKRLGLDAGSVPASKT